MFNHLNLHAIVEFEGLCLGVDGFHAIPREGMLHGTVITPLINHDILSLPWQMAEQLSILLAVAPAIAFQNVWLGDEHLLLRIVVIGAQDLYAGVSGLTHKDGQQLMTIRAVPIAGRHILTVSTAITHHHEAVLAVDGNDERRLVIEYLPVEAFLHCVSDSTDHPCWPRLVEAFEHDAQTTVDDVVDGLRRPLFIQVLNEYVLVFFLSTECPSKEDE